MQTDQVAPQLHSFGLVREGTASDRTSWTLVGRSHLASDLCWASSCLPGLDQWRDSEGMFLKGSYEVRQKH